MSVCPAGHTSQADDYCDVCGMPIDGSASPAPEVGPPPAPDAPADAAAGGAAVGGHPCPNCGTPNAADALFCENCGYDFTTGSMPRPADATAHLERPEADTPPVAPSTGESTPDSTSGSTGGATGGSTGGSTGDTAEVVVPAAGTPRETFDWVAEIWIDPAWYDAQDSPDPLPSPGLPEVLPLRLPSLLVGRKSVSRNIAPEIDCGADSGVSRRQAQLTTDGRRWFVEDLDSANGTFVGSASGVVPTDPIAVGTKHELDADDRIYVGAWTRLVIREATEDEKAGLA